MGSFPREQPDLLNVGEDCLGLAEGKGADAAPLPVGRHSQPAELHDCVPMTKTHGADEAASLADPEGDHLRFAQFFAKLFEGLSQRRQVEVRVRLRLRDVAARWSVMISPASAALNTPAV